MFMLNSGFRVMTDGVTHSRVIGVEDSPLLADDPTVECIVDGAGIVLVAPCPPGGT